MGKSVGLLEELEPSGRIGSIQPGPIARLADAACADLGGSCGDQRRFQFVARQMSFRTASSAGSSLRISFSWGLSRRYWRYAFTPCRHRLYSMRVGTLLSVSRVRCSGKPTVAATENDVPQNLRITVITEFGHLVQVADRLCAS